MSQHDFNIANQGFPATRSDINNALAALASTSSGTSEPSTTYANQFWYDTTNNLLKFRNEADSAWITLAYLDQGTNEWEIRSAVIQAVDSAGVIIKTDDGVARVTVADDGDVTFANDVTISGNLDVSSGTIKLDGNYPTGTNNVALGDTALDSLTTGNYNTAIGADALTAKTTGGVNTAIGWKALELGAAGDYNVGLGSKALQNNTGAYNTAVGTQALLSNTTASSNTAVGYTAGYSNTTGTSNNFLGYQAGYANTTGSSNTAMGHNAFSTNTTGIGNTGFGLQALQKNATSNYNTAVGNQALQENQTGTENEAVGAFALDGNTTGNYNTAIGTSALTDNGIGGQNVAVGRRTLFRNTSSGYNVAVGVHAGYYATGEKNTFIGHDAGSASSFTGSKNTILGRYNGNQGGLDIRTSSNNIVLSDGDGNPRILVGSSGNTYFGTVTALNVTGKFHFSGSETGGGTGVLGIFNSNASADNSPCLTLNKASTTTSSSARFLQFYANDSSQPMGGIVGNGATNVQFASISDERLKENISSISGSLDKINNLRPVEFDLISSGEHVPAGFVAQEVETVFPEYVIQNMSNEDEEPRKGITGGMSAGFVAHLVQAIKELSAKNDELEARITALEAN